MTKREVLKAAQADVKAGKDRKQVFEQYKDQGPRPIQVATIIASVAREEDKQKNKGLNMVLVVLLVLAGVLKTIGVFASLASTNILLAVILALVSLVVPFAFAYEINRFNGAIYGVLTFLAGLGIVNVLLRMGDGPVEALIDVALLGVILALSLTLRKRLFPAMNLLGVKKDGSGGFVLG